jgi:hypothetical protein
VRGTELWVADADGSHLSRLTDGAAAVDWAPEGRRLVVEREGALVVVRADGARERMLTAGAEPAWSSKGRIAFVRGGDVYVVDGNGRGLRRITTTAASESGPAWSRDGRRLAFVATDAAGADLHVVDVVTGVVARLTNDAIVERSPAWSPDGRLITFVANQTAAVTTWTIPAAGGPAVPLAGPVGIDRLRWRPPVSPELRPDLDQQAPRDLSVETVTRGAKPRFLLGFRSATDNVGIGPLSILAFRASPALPTMQASQRVRLAGGGIRTYPRAGFLRYTFSPSHNHWHLMSFQRYELRRAADHALVGRDRKSGFCLTDRWGNAAQGYRGRRPRPVFTDYCQREGTDALFVSQGTSIGYSDVYPAHFHGQNIDITRVRAGTYVLVHRASPELLIRELRYENNAASVRIRIRWPDGRAKAPAVRVLASCPASERCPP